MTKAVEADSSSRAGIARKLRSVCLALCFIALIVSNVASIASSAFNAFVGDILATAGVVTAYRLLNGENLKLKKTVATQVSIRAKMQKAIDKYGVAVKKYQSAVFTHRAEITRRGKIIDSYKIDVAKHQAALRLQEQRIAAFKKRVELKQIPARNAGGAIASRNINVAKAGVARIPVETVPYLGVAVLVAGIVYDLNAMCHNMQDLNTLYESCGMEDRVNEDWMRYMCNPPIPSIDSIRGQLRWPTSIMNTPR